MHGTKLWHRSSWVNSIGSASLFNDLGTAFGDVQTRRRRSKAKKQIKIGSFLQNEDKYFCMETRLQDLELNNQTLG